MHGIKAPYLKTFFGFFFKAWFKAVQAIETLGCLFLLASLVACIIRLKYIDRSFIEVVIVGCVIVAGKINKFDKLKLTPSFICISHQLF